MKEQCIMALSPPSQEIISKHVPFLTGTSISRPRWEDNIKMDFQDVGCGGYGLDRAGSG